MIDIYTPKEAAIEIIQERKQNLELKERVAAFLGKSLPDDCFDLQQPIGFLARYVPRATGEDRIFADEAQDAGLTPYWASYTGDRFTTRNPEKVELRNQRLNR